MKLIPLKTDQNHPAIKAYVAAIVRGEENQHVWQKEGFWIVKQSNGKRENKRFDSFAEAIEFADAEARRLRNSYFVHGEDGDIIERRDYDL